MRVFRRRELSDILHIPQGTQEKRREAELMPNRLAFWSYYAEMYRAKYERILHTYEKFESHRRSLIERAIIDQQGSDYATTQNISSVYYQIEAVTEHRERISAALHRYNVLKVVLDALREKAWMLKKLINAPRFDD